MNYQNQIPYTAARPVTGLRLRQQLKRRRMLDLPGGGALWAAVAKAVCIVMTITLGLNLYSGYLARQLHQSIQAVEAEQHAFRNDQMTLLAERARLMSRQHVQEQARLELALHVPGGDQVFKLR